METLREKQKAQDPAMSTNYFKSNILKEDIYSKSLLCQQHEETTDYLTAGCPHSGKQWVLNKTHWSWCTCALLNMQNPRQWNDRQMVYTHTPKPVCAQKDVSVVESSSTYTERSYSKYARYNKWKQKRENTHTDICGNTWEQKCHAKGSRIETITQELM